MRTWGPEGAAVPREGRQTAGDPRPARLDRWLGEYLGAAGIDADLKKSVLFHSALGN